MLRFPKEYSDCIGKYANIYRIDSSHFLVEIVSEEENKTAVRSFKTQDDISMPKTADSNVNENPQKHPKPEGMRGQGGEKFQRNFASTGTARTK